ncbi:MAG: hypothetical protein CMM93_04240 [Rickettsiales bacterium]|nr:hypothetical protein [Rickettsiales bacterium]
MLNPAQNQIVNQVERIEISYLQFQKSIFANIKLKMLNNYSDYGWVQFNLFRYGESNVFVRKALAG